METEHHVLRTASGHTMRTRSSKNRLTANDIAIPSNDVVLTTRDAPLLASVTTTTTTTNSSDGSSLTTTTATVLRSPRSTRTKNELHTFERLHQEGFAYLADNSYIRSGYRLNYSVRDCFLSLFELHNETLNVWTHIIGSIIFVLLMAYLTLSSSALSRASGMLLPTSSNNATDLHAAVLPAWTSVSPDALFVTHGRHTPRLFYTTALASLYPLCVQSPLALPPQTQHYYDVASELFAHSLHQIPSLARFHDVLERNMGDMADSVALQTELLKTELLELRDRLQRHVSNDVEQLELLKASVHARVDGFSTYVQSLATHVGADLPVQYAVAELHALADSVRNGLHILATAVDNTMNHDVPHWPIFVFMASAVICLTCSALFHLLFVHSKSAYAVLSRLDYAGITILIAGSFYPLIYYAFYCQPIAQRVYLTAITIMAGLTFCVTLTPTFGTPNYLVFRTSLFLALGFFGVVPVTHLIWHFGLFDPHVTVMIGPLLLMALLYTLGALIYATKFPERFYPGRFDVWCSSHQLWHVCVVAAALVHFVNALQHYEWRWNTTCDV